MKWSFYQIWNESLEEGNGRRAVKPRDRIWASEMGGALIDRWLKMKGIQPSNPPNKRSLRKFEAGNIWESIIGYVLQRAGILITRQTWLQYQYPGLLAVSGKLDYEAGGRPDYDKAAFVIQKEFNWLPEFISKATHRIVDRLKEEYPGSLERIILEIKSCSAFMFERYEKTNEGSLHHKMQLFHYLKSTSKEEGHIVYICKDDARLIEIGVMNPSPIEVHYKQDIENISHYYFKNERPPLEKPITFDENWGKFSANWKIGYSQYLTLLYELKNQKEFDNKYKPITERWNRVLGRITGDKDMTDNNKEALTEMRNAGFDIDKIREIVIKQKEEKDAKTATERKD